MTIMTPDITMKFSSHGEQTAASIVKSLLAAFQNFSLYSQNHVICTQCVDQLFSEITQYINLWGSFGFDISRDGIHFDCILISPSQGNEDAFVYPLVRDGIYRLTFLKGLHKKSIYTLFEIIRNNRILNEKSQGDTVTDLWNADFQHIVHQTADIYWDRESGFIFPNPTQGEPVPLIERSFRRSSNKKKKDLMEKRRKAAAPGTSRKPSNLDGTHFTEKDIILTTEEQARLRSMVSEQESIRTENEILNLLLLMIDEVSRPDDLENILTNLSVEFHRIISHGKLHQAFDIIQAVKEYQKSHDWMAPSSEAKIQAFLDHISSKIFLDSYQSFVPLLNRNRPEDIACFKNLCLSLAPSVAISLCEAIVYLESQSSKNFLMDIIKIKTREDISVIERMLESTDKMIALIGVSLLKNIKDTNSDMLLHRMLLHPVEQVRYSALDYFIDKPLTILPRIFFLIDDPSMDIKNKVLKFIGSRRSIHSESLMTDYLKDQIHFPADRDHIRLCYKTLGQCGSDRSIAFLKKRLFANALINWNGSKSYEHRVGALIALSELKYAAASKIISKASKSKLPAVIKAYRTVFDKNVKGLCN